MLLAGLFLSILCLTPMTLPILNSAPPLSPRKETVELPELGGSVIVRGLLASEIFGVIAMRQAALRRLRPAPAPAADPDGPMQAPEQEPEPDIADYIAYGRHTSQLLALAVVDADGMAFYSADEWEIFAQHHPGAYARLQAEAERLSGLNTEAVAKNSPQSPS